MSTVTFNPAPWFDALVDYSQRQRGTMQSLLAVAERFPNRHNLEKAREIVASMRPVLFLHVLRSIDAILNGEQEIKDTYRHRYHAYPKWGGQVSATGELFSLLRQAITYHDR